MNRRELQALFGMLAAAVSGGVLALLSTDGDWLQAWATFALICGVCLFVTTARWWTE